MVWVGYPTAGALAIQKRFENTLIKQFISNFYFSLKSGKLVRVFSEGVVTETDTHAVRLSASSRHRQQATGDGVCLLQTPDLF